MSTTKAHEWVGAQCGLRYRLTTNSCGVEQERAAVSLAVAPDARTGELGTAENNAGMD